MVMDTVLVYDLHASENGALAILKDFYEDAINQKNINWVFIVSNAKISKAHNVQVLSYPWVKKSWFHRLFFQFFIEKKIIKEFKPSILLSLQNFPGSWFKGKQMVYLHQAIFVTDLKFSSFIFKSVIFILFHSFPCLTCTGTRLYPQDC